VNLISVLPEILILAIGILILIVEPFWKPEDRHGLGWLTAGGLVLTALVSLLFGRPSAPELVWGGMLRFDWLGFFFKMLFLFGGAATVLFLMGVEQINRRGEVYVLLLASLLGMNLMVSSANLVMLYLAIETTSIPLYVLAGFLRTDDKSTEAGFKYLLFGVMASAVMLYGFSLLVGFSGTTDMYAMVEALRRSGLPLFSVIGVILLLLVGFGFKVAAVPFHFWAPDVYEGAPTPIAGFLSTASKAAAFVVLLRVFLVLFPLEAVQWSLVLAILAALTMTLGNLLALAQKNIKRLLAYSSIAHAGYVLIGVAAISTESGEFFAFSISSVAFYLLVYLVTNLLAFGVVITYYRVVGSDDIPAYNGLSWRHPWLALALLAALLSLAGMPPFGGFIAKVVIFAAAIKVGLIWLAVVGVLNSIVGLYYYLIVLKHVYLYRNEALEGQPLPIPGPYAIALVVLALGVLLLGTVFGPWFSLAEGAAAAFF